MSNYDFSSVILGVIAKQLTMLERNSEGVLVPWKPWLKLIGNVEAINLTMKPEKPNFKRKVSYVEYFMSRTLKLIKTKDEVLGTTTLQDLIDRAELRAEDEKLLEVEIAETCEFAKETGILL